MLSSCFSGLESCRDPLPARAQRHFGFGVARHARVPPRRSSMPGDGAAGAGDGVVRDSRFKTLHNDPRFMNFPAATNKTKIDGRFAKMFSDPNFGTGARGNRDKRGRKTDKARRKSAADDLKQYYDLEEEEEEEEEERDAAEKKKSAAKKRAKKKRVDPESDEEDRRRRRKTKTTPTKTTPPRRTPRRTPRTPTRKTRNPKPIWTAAWRRRAIACEASTSPIPIPTRTLSLTRSYTMPSVAPTRRRV